MKCQPFFMNFLRKLVYQVLEDKNFKNFAWHQIMPNHNPNYGQKESVPFSSKIAAKFFRAWAKG